MNKGINNKYMILALSLIMIGVLMLIGMFFYIMYIDDKEGLDNLGNNMQEVIAPIPEEPIEVVKTIDNWKLLLVNKSTSLPEDFTVELASIDQHRQFDKRAIDEIVTMMNDIKKAGITNLWIQSAYRSIEKQRQLFNDSVNKYTKQGKTREEAESITEETINRPGTSEHNLGLAIDFNYVDYGFDKLAGFNWLIENAENYGFILRYPKDKTDITKVDYEPWHWRYVGKEDAKKINELGYCLEEYIEYLLK